MLKDFKYIFLIRLKDIYLIISIMSWGYIVLNIKMQDLKYSGIRKFFNEVKKHENVISLTLGQPDFNIPKSIENGIVQALKEGKTVYTINNGIPELREKISNYLNSEYNINFSKDEIIITVGGSESLFVTFNTLFNEGEYVLTPNPGYPAYENTLKFIGAKPLFYEISSKNGIDFEGIENYFKNYKVKGIVLCFPNNPTGLCLSSEDKERLHKILLKFPECKIISDEMYSSITYDKFETICTYDDLIDRVILVSGFSKTFSMTGLRLGYICAKGEYINQIIKLHLYAVSCATSIVQYGTLYGFDDAVKESKLMVEEFRKRRDFICNSLTSMGFNISVPKGAFYLFASLEGITNMNSYDFAVDLMKKGKVACVPGSCFGDKGEGHIRISYCNSIDELSKGMERINNYLKN